MRKRTKLLALLAAASLCLSGCMFRVQEPMAAGEISLPEPSEEPRSMILGETLSNTYSDVTLYFASSDGTAFSTVTRSIRRETGKTLPGAVVDALLAAMPSETSRSIGDTRALSCEYACGTVTVNLSLDARSVQSLQDLLALEASISNTLLDIDGVSAVNVLIGDVSESFFQLPLGAQTAEATSTTALYAQMLAEGERLEQDDSAVITRTALLYFPTEGGDWLIPEQRTLEGPNGDFVLPLIDALMAGPQQEPCAVASIPEGVELLDENPKVVTLSSGERLLSLNFSSALANYLAFSGLEVWELAGSITLTMCSFLPDLDAVRIMVNGDPITMCDTKDGIIQFPEGMIRRGSFSSRIGSTASLYLASPSGALRPVTQAVSMLTARSPRSLLAELFRFDGGDGAALRLPVSESLYAEDVLGVQVSGGVAKVNLSANFYRSCQGLNATDERNLVYAMVNTLCQLETIHAVRFYVEGYAADTLAGGIYLKSALLPNPGIIATTTDDAAR